MDDRAKGIRIRDARKAKGLTQKQLADLLGCSHTTVSKYEQGEIENMPQPRMKLLSEILDVSPIVLFDFAETKKEPAMDDELSAVKMQLVEWIRNMPETEAVGILAALNSNQKSR